MTNNWLAALDSTSVGLGKIVQELPEEKLALPAFGRPGGWSVGQVLSHLGSAAEICTTLVRRGAEGDLTPPTGDDAKPVWAKWDAMAGPEQRESWFEADRTHRDLLATVGESITIPYFAGPLSLSEYAGYRLSEQALHGWDIEVVLDREATVRESELLWQRIDLIVSRFHDADARKRLAPRTVTVADGRLEITESELHFTGTKAENRGEAQLTGGREAVLRLFYGRNRPEDDLQTAGDTTLDDLRQLFSGF
ncbi:maleylpyruvate isomerase N-terminal domain-containing protein [Amycolatopsis sp. NPDC051372]|uniref:maleylpyruvate isomerase N-terminal domain-containing protein n=1 Tax=Amycolatopsis sp. NPDC051372 TaxID=3155669 RepID=UPI003449032F